MAAFEVIATARAPIGALWSLLDDSRNWPTWTPIDTAVVLEAADPGEVGEVRRFTNGRVTVTERIVRREAPSRLAYELLSGLAVRDYRAEITLDEAVHGTDVRWATRFEPKVPGTAWLYRRALLKATREFVDGLVRAVEERRP